LDEFQRIRHHPTDQQTVQEKEHIIPLTSKQRDAVLGELKRIEVSLNLSDNQKQELQAFYNRRFREACMSTGNRILTQHNKMKNWNRR
jgi:hypothetical protein